MTVRSFRAHSVLTAVSTTLMTPLSKRALAKLRRTPGASSAPKRCAVTIEKPEHSPCAKPMMRNVRLPVQPTAASASTSSVRPTMNVSAILYSC